MSNVKTVQGIYEAVGRQDVPAILEPLSDDVAWDHWDDNRAHKAGVPYLEPRNGKDGVVAWLQSLGDLELRGMQALNFLEGENQVAVTFEISFVVKATGKLVSDQEVHVWTFDDDGKVIALRHYVDTAKHIEANS